MSNKVTKTNKSLTQNEVGTCPNCGGEATPTYGCKECYNHVCHSCKNFIQTAKEGYRYDIEKELFVEEEKDELI